MTRLWIPGVPEPQPRPRIRKLGKGADAQARMFSPTTKWRKAVRAELERAQAEGLEPIPAGEPVAADLIFSFPRPKGHMGTGRNGGRVKDSAPAFPVTRSTGDIDNLAKAVLDAGNEILFADDSQVVHLTVRTLYATVFSPPGCTISIDTLSPVR